MGNLFQKKKKTKLALSKIFNLESINKTGQNIVPPSKLTKKIGSQSNQTFFLHLVDICQFLDIHLVTKALLSIDFCTSKNWCFSCFNMEPIMPNFIFLCFQIFAVELECLKHKANACNMKWTSLIAKKQKKQKNMY